MTDELRTLAAFLREAAENPPDEAIASAVSTAVVDTFGVAMAATSSSHLRAAIAADEESGQYRDLLGNSTTLGNAASTGATLAHGLDFDDTHFPSILHPSSVVVPVCLAAVTARPDWSPRFVGAVAGGRELAVRLGMAGLSADGRQSRFFRRGFHTTAMCGAIGAAGALGALAGLPEPVVAHAMGITTSLVGGLVTANRAGGTVKPIHMGWAARSAVAAVRYAKAGVTGPADALTGRFGFLDAFAGSQRTGVSLLVGLGRTWQSLTTHTKAYPANHFTHAAIDGALRLRSEFDVGADEVTWIELGLPSPVLPIVSEPRWRKIAPATPYEARFSAPYVVAATLTGDMAGPTLGDFSPRRFADIACGHVIERIGARPDADATRLFPERLTARVTIHQRQGTPLTTFVDAVTGSPLAPLGAATLQAKLRDCREHADQELDWGWLLAIMAGLGLSGPSAAALAAHL